MGIDQDARRIREQLEEMDAAVVRVALFGQPGAGKSSLINALTGRDLAEVGVTTDKTTEARAYDWQGLHLVDLPGYDTKRFPKEKYLKQFDIPSFDLFLCVFAGKFTSADDELLFRELKRLKKVCLFVHNKSDEMWQPGATPDQLKAEIVGDLRRRTGDPSANVIFTSCRTLEGLDALTDAIHESLDAAKAERWARTAAAHSERLIDAKRAACERRVTLCAGLSAANALNPIPGVDVAIDMSILVNLFSEIRNAFGLTNAALSPIEHLPRYQAQVRNLIAWGTTDGLVMLLKRFATRETAKELTKWVPVVGQAIASLLGFTIVQLSGSHYTDVCTSLARGILEQRLKRSAGATAG